MAVAADARWEELAPLPVPNGGFVAGASRDGIMVAGGVTWRGETKIWLDGIWHYDPARNTWRDAGRLPAAVAYSTLGVAPGVVWFAGGSSGESTHRTLWRMDAGKLPRVVATLERGFVNSCGALIGDILYVVGGTDDQAHVERATNTSFAVDVRTGAMKRLPDYPEPSLITGAAAAAGFGGARWVAAQNSVENHSSAHAFDPADARWEKLPALPHPGRGFTAIALDEQHILIAGGYRNDAVEFVRDAYIYDVRSKTYRPTTPLPYAAMVTLLQSGEWLYCLGGEDRKRHRTDAVFRIRWQPLLATK